VIAYLDASVILRIVFGEENPLAQWRSITHGRRPTPGRTFRHRKSA